MIKRVSRKKKTSRRRSPVDVEQGSLVLDEGVLDLDAAAEVIPYTYSITAYGADYPVDSLVKRLRSGDITVPLFSLPADNGSGTVRFQREFVWKKLQSDRFIESLLLGLPVPGIFLVKEPKGDMLVLDGHQRLQTLRRFYDNDWEGKPYSLAKVQERFQECGYDALEAEDRRRLDDSIIHATVVRQDEPSEDQSSIYLVFERLNAGGTILQPQEIRVALYNGPLVSMLSTLNELSAWRTLFGKKSRRLKDIELILRFFALFHNSRHYARPMKGFLNAYMAKHKRADPETQKELKKLFASTTEAILKGIGAKAFKPKNAVNAALVDAVLVAVARRIKAEGAIKRPRDLKQPYRNLLLNKRFQRAISRSTADEENVKARLKLATVAFESVR